MRHWNNQKDTWSLRKTAKLRLLVTVLAALGMTFLSLEEARAEKYLPPGYSSGQNVDGVGWGLDLGYKLVDEDYYLTATPLLEIPVYRFRIGIQIPLEILMQDNEPTGTQKTGTLREGMYDENSDYLSLIRYIRYGKHLYFDPDDKFNWSFFYGEMKDGYIGHKTIIHRYVGTYDSTYQKHGMMFDINGNWGGLELFQSDVWRREVVGARVYARPVGLFITARNLIAGNFDLRDSRRMVALSRTEGRDPELNGGVFFQERLPDDSGGGSIGQQNHSKFNQEKFDSDAPVKFVEVTDPVTGETQVRAVPQSEPSRNTRGGRNGDRRDPTTVGRNGKKTIGEVTGDKKTTAKGGKTGPGGKPAKYKDDEKKSRWGPSFWSRWAVGYSVIRDYSAPLTLERDGSNNLVIDPDTGRPTAETDENLTFIGMDTEFRLSPFRFLDVTPYVDMNKVKDLENSKGLHAGVNVDMRLFGTFMKLSVRPEYREFNSNYIPGYFDSYYTLERTTYTEGSALADSTSISDDSVTKLTYLKSLPEDDGLTKGYFLEVMLELASTLVIELTIEDYDGPDNTKVFVGVYLPNLFGFFMNGYYMKRGFDDFTKSFEFDTRSLIAAELGYTLVGPFYIKVTYERTWAYDSDTNALEAVDEKQVSFGFSTSL